jgi:hypothetical protein
MKGLARKLKYPREAMQSVATRVGLAGGEVFVPRPKSPHLSFGHLLLKEKNLLSRFDIKKP